MILYLLSDRPVKQDIEMAADLIISRTINIDRVMTGKNLTGLVMRLLPHIPCSALLPGTGIIPVRKFRIIVLLLHRIHSVAASEEMALTGNRFPDRFKSQRFLR